MRHTKTTVFYKLHFLGNDINIKDKQNMIEKGYLIKKKVLFIDLDDTIIKTISGNTFPTDVTDFKYVKRFWIR